MDPDHENRQEDQENENQAEQEQRNEEENQPEEGQPEEQKAEETEAQAETTEVTNVEETKTEAQTQDQTQPTESTQAEGTQGIESSWQNLNASAGTQQEGQQGGETHQEPAADVHKEEEHKEEEAKPTETQPTGTEPAINLAHSTGAAEKTTTSGSQSPAKSLTIEERYNQSVDLKNKANDLIKEKKYEEAIALYKSAGLLINPNVLPGQPEGDLKFKLNDLRIALSNNMSHCYLHMGMYDLAFEQAEKVERLDPENIKALYRIAVCLEKQGKNLEAFDKIKTVIKISNAKGQKISSEVQEIFERLKGKTKEITEKIRAEEKQTKELAQKMFGEKPPKQTESAAKKYLYKGLMVVPSVGIAYLLLTKGMKSNLKTQNSKFALGVLSASIFGTLTSSKIWMKGIFATTFVLVAGLAHKYKAKI